MAEFLPAVPVFPASGYYTQEDFLRLFDRLLPDYYLAPMKPEGNNYPNKGQMGAGYEYLQAVAAVMSRVSQSVAHMNDAGFVGTAVSGSRATSSVKFYRPNAIFGEVTFLIGTIVGTFDGYLYRTTADVTLGATDLESEAVEVEAIAKGYDWNKPGPIEIVRDSGTEVIEGTIDRLVTAVLPLDAVNMDPTVKVKQLTPASGGASNTLDGVGQDRGIFRQFNYASVAFKRTGTTAAQAILLPGTRVATAADYLYQLLDTVRIPAGDSTTEEFTARALPVVKPDAVPADPITDLVLPRWGSVLQPGLSVVEKEHYRTEPDEDYRVRVALLPTVVTPNAVELLLKQTVGWIFQPMGLAYGWREVWDIRFQSAYSETSWPSTGANDFPINQTFDQAEISAPVDAYSSNIFVYDYAPEDEPLTNRYMGSNGMIVFALPKDEQYLTLYAGLAELLDGATAAGIPLGYVFS